MVKKHIDMFTSDQYDLLGDMIGAQKVAGNSRSGAIRWVWFRWSPKSSISALQNLLKVTQISFAQTELPV